MQIDGVFVILIILLMLTMGAIYKLYQTEVDSVTFIRGVYLYLLLTIVFISLLTKYTATMSITETEHMGKMVIWYFILAFLGLCLVYNSNPWFNHFGLMLLCVSLSLTMGVTYRYSQGITDALVISSMIIFVLTMMTFYSSEQQLMTYVSWLPYLTGALCFMLIIMLGVLYFGATSRANTMISLILVMIFVGFIIADTGKLVTQSKDLNCVTHTCINYPEKTVGLLLDYVNLFVNVNNLK